MEVQLTCDLKAFVREAIQSGRLRREEDAVKEALSLWEERERTRAEILAAVDDAEASVVRGQGRIVMQESMRELARQLSQFRPCPRRGFAPGPAELSGRRIRHHLPLILRVVRGSRGTRRPGQACRFKYAVQSSVIREEARRSRRV